MYKIKFLRRFRKNIETKSHKKVPKRHIMFEKINNRLKIIIRRHHVMFSRHLLAVEIGRKVPAGYLDKHINELEIRASVHVISIAGAAFSGSRLCFAIDDIYGSPWCPP